MLNGTDGVWRVVLNEFAHSDSDSEKLKASSFPLEDTIDELLLTGDDDSMVSII